MNKIFIILLITVGTFWNCSTSKNTFTLNDKAIKKNANYTVSFRFYNLSSQIEDVFKKNESEIDSIVLFIKNHPKYIFEIGVYTDYRGAEAFNLKLSQKQAECFANYLIQKDTNPDQLEEKGYGETNLIYNEAAIDTLQSEDEKTNAHLENGRIIIKRIKQ
ncbi:MAG: OmpA family protein [Bacteroidetes bacterium]|nr:OmpA family protein [Bacteroidota bacterium]